MEGRVQSSGLDQDLLVSELRHRLANSFQLLQAVIRVRLRSAEDPESRRHLSWLLDVVAALGMLQQRIGMSGPTDFGAYLIEATAYWRRLCEGRSVDIVVQVDSCLVTETEASVLALVTHELISNCVEHAFPNGRSGHIEVGFAEAGDGALILSVSDNGAGPPQDGSNDRQGLKLVRGLSAHLQGVVSVEAGDGMTVRVRFPRQPEPPKH
jgi:two-component sensor histidine kinase